MSLKQVLLAAAKPKINVVEIAGQKVNIREPMALTLMDYARVSASDRTTAMADLIKHCVVDDDGEELFSLDEALEIVNGTGTVLMPLINAITKPETEVEVKNDSAQTGDSSLP